MHKNIILDSIQIDVKRNVCEALEEDIGSGDITAELIPKDEIANAQVITREDGILCGQAWVDEVYGQLDPSVSIKWLAQDGDWVNANQTLFELKGPARSLLTGERTALNFLQTLSGVATTSHMHAQLVKGTLVKVLDTRKTLPGLRIAQKYAVNCGGCHNHRIGLYDAYLIKENHIAACGSISLAVQTAKQNKPNTLIEVEVENMEEFEEASSAGADIIMLDNFDLAQIKSAVAENKGLAKIEVSGGLESNQIKAIAETGVDFISIGGLTKHCRAMDLSFRIIKP